MKHITRENNFLIIHNTHKSRSFINLMRDKRAIYQANSGTYKLKYIKGCWKEFEELGYKIPDYIKQEMTLENYMKIKYLKVKLPENITKNLYPYQVEGIRKLEAGWSFLCDMQGLGKTPQSCRFLELHKEYKTNVIVCPGFLKEKWGYELDRWSTKKYKILYGQKEEILESNITYIINYDILEFKLHSLAELEIDCIIADEVHLCKTADIKRTEALNILVKFAKRFIPMTGTPILNDPMEIYNTLHLIDPLQFYSQMLFQNEYCIVDFSFGKKIFIGSKNEQKLYNKLKTSIMIRRTYNEVSIQFGTDYSVQIIPDIIPIKLDSYKEYLEADKDIVAYVRRVKGARQSRRIEKSQDLHRPRILKEIIYENKKEYIFKWVDNFLESNSKICLFFMRTDHLNEFVKYYGRKALKINGEVDTGKRFELCNMFNRSRRLKVLCGNIKACGVGLDLIGSSTICFIDFDWNFSNMEQVIKRADRFGQKSPFVHVYYFTGKDTIEDSYIMEKLDKKNNIAKKIVDGRSLKNSEKFTRKFK